MRFTYLPNVTTKGLLLLAYLGCLAGVSQAQTVNDAQFWLDYLVYKPFGKNLLEMRLGYRTILSQEGKWRSLNVRPTYQRSINPYWDFLSSLGISYTLQQEGSHTFEIRPMLGSRFNFTPKHRVQTRLTVRFEHRFLYDAETAGWEQSNRSRFRGEFIVSLNRPSNSSNHLWYALADAEAFFTVDKNVSERFSNRLRFRLGLGYRLSYNLRFEALYMFQQSREQLGDDFDTIDHIIRLRIKHYLTEKVKQRP